MNEFELEKIFGDEVPMTMVIDTENIIRYIHYGYHIAVNSDNPMEDFNYLKLNQNISDLMK